MCKCQTEKNTYTHEVLAPIDFDAQSRDVVTAAVMLRRDTDFIAHARNSDIAQQLEAACSEVERLRAENAAMLHDLETSVGLYCCDNAEGQSLFQLEHLSLKPKEGLSGHD